jgi:two-component system, chemotaxis family, response regulator Rcp1
MGKLRSDKSSAQVADRSNRTAGRPLQVLLVEDNTADVLLFDGALQEIPLKVEVQVAHDAEKALALLSDNSFETDLVVLDLNLPKFSGYQVLERYTRKSVPVVVFTSSRSEVDARCALALGASDVVQKPSELRPYRDAVRTIIEKWAARSSDGNV